MSGDLAIRDEQHYLSTLSEIRALVERIETVDEAKELADRARAAQVWAQRANLHAIEIMRAAAVKLFAEHRAGGLLEETVRPRGRNSSGNGALPEGITRMQSSRWQRLAEIPRDEFDAICEDAIQAGRISLAEVLRRADRARRERRKAEEEAELVANLRNEGGPRWQFTVADLRSYAPGPVDAIVTDPPYVTADAVELYAALGQFAARALKPGGALVAMTWQPILPAVLQAFETAGLRYRWTVAWVTGSHETTVDHARRVQDRWKPVVVFHRDQWSVKTPMLVDVVFTARDQSKTSHPWQQDLDGFRQLVRGVTAPGDLVCDPFLGSGTTALAALAEDRHFVGCDIDSDAVQTARRRLAA